MKALDSIIFGKVKHHTTSAKQLWNKLIYLTIINERIRENKLNILVQKFDSSKMLSSETIDKMETYFTNILGELMMLQKYHTQRELNSRVLHALPKKWLSKVTAIKAARSFPPHALNPFSGIS